jgi:hypothetical protein
VWLASPEVVPTQLPSVLASLGYSGAPHTYNLDITVPSRREHLGSPLGLAVVVDRRTPCQASSFKGRIRVT